MTAPAELTARFLSRHEGPSPLLMPNAWDAGSAKLLASLGFEALATTSSGFAATLGRLDGSVTLDEALAHSGDLAAAVDVPVSGDLENCFADDPAGVAATVARAAATGLAGCSIEDFTGDRDDPIYDAALAAERVEAAAEAAHAGPVRLVLTARAEGLLHGRPDLDDIVTRLQSFAAAGADVLFAPGLNDAKTIGDVVAAVDRPLSVLALAGGPNVAELRDAGVARISVGGALLWTALGAVVDAARELLDDGTFGYFEKSATGRNAARTAFASP